MSKRNIWFISMGGVLLIGYIIYKTLFPGGPILDSLPNPIKDRSVEISGEDDITINPLKEAYFGDLHIHTGMSLDAFIGGIRTTPEEAYEFAKGETINVLDTVNAFIQRPLDFAAVTDHSEFLGELYSIHTRGAPAHRSMAAIFLRSIGLDTLKQQELFLRTTGAAKQNAEGFRSHLPFFQGFETTVVGWQIHIDAANAHYEPGKFTTLAAYEWSLGGAATHKHRNVFFGDMNVPEYPISALEAKNEYELWKSLERMQKEGADVIAIPHNSNLSGGKTFTHTQPDGSPYDLEYAKLRNEYEPLAEIHQAKGNSEVSAALWPNDEFANFENYSRPSPDTLTNYVRHALKMGLEHQSKLGVNPFKYGLIGSTDTHNGVPGNTEEDDIFIGNHALLDLFPEQRSYRDFPGYDTPVYEIFNPGGLTGVWAGANTRPEIFGALKRKETYATSGTRIKIRLFGGSGFNSDHESYEDLVKDGYAKGVPMGGDLDIEEDVYPEFLVWAVKDPMGANLDRVQIIKGWYEEGELKEKIYNVVVSDEREINADGSTSRTSASVDLKTGETDKNIGAVSLSKVWVDRDFDPNLQAFYYVRVLENPSLRWSAWDELRYGSSFPDRIPKKIQERAWSSPIWYAPK